MTFAAVGATIVGNMSSQAGSNTSTISLTPNTVGNFILFEASDIGSGTPAVATSMSSSNVTWTALGSSFSVTNATLAVPATYQVFIGIITSTSTQTVTIHWSGNTIEPLGTGQEFSSTVGASSVTLDVQGNFNASLGSTTWASLTPNHGAGELYFGYASDNGAAVAGNTSGYVYAISSDGHGDGSAYNVNCPNSATAPVWGDNQHCAGIMVLVYEKASAALPAGPRLSSFQLPNFPVISAIRSGSQGAGHSR